MGEDWNPVPPRQNNQLPSEESTYSRSSYLIQQPPSGGYTTNWKHSRQPQQDLYMGHPNEQHIGNRPYLNPSTIEKNLGEIINNLTSILSLLQKQSEYYLQPSYQTRRPLY